VVRTIFARYLELGSMGALLAELDRQGIRTKVNVQGHVFCCQRQETDAIC